MSDEGIKTYIWWTQTKEQYLQSFLLMASGPHPYIHQVFNYDLVNGTGLDGRWAYIATHLLHPVPDAIIKEYVTYRPVDCTTSRLYFTSPTIKDEEIIFNEIPVDTNDPVYRLCSGESKKELENKLKKFIEYDKKDHHIFLYRIRIDDDKLFLDVGPYSEEKINIPLADWGNIVTLRFGISIPPGETVAWDTEKITLSDNPGPLIQEYNNITFLNDVKTEEPVRFQYVSFPYSLQYVEGPPSCHINDQVITISRGPGIHYKITAELIVEYMDCSRSGRAIQFCDKLFHHQKENIRNFPDEAANNLPLLCLYLETQEI